MAPRKSSIIVSARQQQQRPASSHIPLSFMPSNKKQESHNTLESSSTTFHNVHHVIAPVSPTTPPASEYNAVDRNELLMATTLQDLEALKQDSTFFKFNHPRSLPTFELNEVAFGRQLGQGEFGTVSEVNRFLNNRREPSASSSSTSEPSIADFAEEDDNNCGDDDDDDDDIDLEDGIHPTLIFNNNNNMDLANKENNIGQTSRRHLLEREPSGLSHDDTTNDDDDGDEDLTMHVWETEQTVTAQQQPLNDKSNHELFSCFDSPDQLKRSMIRNVHRNGLCRYAVKQVRRDLLNAQQQQNNYDDNNDHLLSAVTDLAREAKFLQSLNHSNICKLRATCGDPGSLDFCIVIDCMPFGTLRNYLQKWSLKKNGCPKSSSTKGLLSKLYFHNRGNREMEEEFLEQVYHEQLTVVLDISRGLEYLHSKYILYRDLKPDNIGINVRGDVRIFDFGLAKELRVKECIEPPNGYQATGVTGTRRYMAPEVAKSLLYGLPADVYSFSILAWQILTLQTPFESMSAEVHFKQVIHKGARPKLLSSLSKSLRAILTQGWSPDPNKRPEIRTIHQAMKSELDTGSERSSILMNKSWKSLMMQG